MSYPQYLTKVFLWMFFGVLLTFISGYLLYRAHLQFLLNFPTILLLFSIQVVLIIFLRRSIHQFTPLFLKLGFIFYAISTGIVFSSILTFFHIHSIFIGFLLSALLFFSFIILSTITKRDLTNYSTLLYGGLFTFLFFQLLNLFYLKLPVIDVVLASFGLFLFLGFSIYDLQLLRKLYKTTYKEKQSIIGAFAFYLDFMNVFWYTLELLGITDKT